jgi:hypothetical protein
MRHRQLQDRSVLPSSWITSAATGYAAGWRRLPRTCGERRLRAGARRPPTRMQGKGRPKIIANINDL